MAKGIPTLIIAIAGIDDALSVALFGIIESAMFSSGSLTFLILQAPVSIIGGICFGVFWGFVCYYAPEKNDPYVVNTFNTKTFSENSKRNVTEPFEDYSPASWMYHQRVWK